MGEPSLDHPLRSGPPLRSSAPVAPVEPAHWVGLVCSGCEVAWRGDPEEPCWSCGARDGYEPVLAVDDDPRNLAMYRSEGVPTVYLHSGYYD